MRVLIIDNHMDRDCWGAEKLKSAAQVDSSLTFFIRRAPQEDLPKRPKDFDSIIISGSRTRIEETAPWVQKLEDFIQSSMNEQVPILGICYGHQLLAKILGGRPSVGVSETPEVGWTEIETLNHSVLTHGIPKRFHSYSYHFDEVKSVPDSCEVLFKSKNCLHQGFQVKEKPFFGIQFHPETDVKSAESTFQSLRRKGKSDLFQNAKEGHKLYTPKIAQNIFLNFLKLSK